MEISVTRKFDNTVEISGANFNSSTDFLIIVAAKVELHWIARCESFHTQPFGPLLEGTQ